MVTAVAGTGVRGFSGDGGPATAARLAGAEGIAVDALGSVYIADYNNSRVRKVRSDGTITTIAGDGRTGFAGDGGPASEASIFAPVDVAVDGQGILYITDEIGQRVRMVGRDGAITTIAGTGRAGSSGDGGPATSARVNVPYGVAVDVNGNVYITEYTGNRVRKIRRPAAVAAATPTPAITMGYFKTPSGNIVCYRAPGPPEAFLVCGVKSGLEPKPPYTAGCKAARLDYNADRIVLRATGRAKPVACSGDAGPFVGERRRKRARLRPDVERRRSSLHVGGHGSDLPQQRAVTGSS